MKFVTWNINGIKSALTKRKDGSKVVNPPQSLELNVLQCIISEQSPDFICLQEVKCQESIEKELSVFKGTYPFIYVNCSKARKGYSGVAVFSKLEPLGVFSEFERYTVNDLGEDVSKYDFTKEGRLLTLEYPSFFLVNCYTPNSKQKLERLEQRTSVWEPLFRKYINKLQKEKPVILCGDLNVAHEDIDIYNTKGKSKMAGFTAEERGEFKKLILECDLVDTYRELHPNKKEYTYFSNFAKAREKNNGWRIDYFLVSRKLAAEVKAVSIHCEYFGSDHVPVTLSARL